MGQRIYYCYNGEIVTPDELYLSAENRSFRYGDGIFETIRCFGNQPILFDKHYHRLLRASGVLEINMKSIPSRELLLKKIETLINKNKYFGSSRVRLALFRSDGGLYTPHTNDCNYLIEVTPLATNDYVLNSKGIVASVYQDMKKTPSIISPFKTSNSLLFVLAALFKEKQNLADVFIMNTENKIIESLASNLFWFKDDYLFTPSISSGCVDGIMRNFVIEVARKNIINVVEIPGIEFTELMEADEIFTTNAIQGINWIVGIDHKRFYNLRTAKLHRIVQEELRRQISQ